MKKLMLTALVVFSMTALAKAGGELRSTPRGDAQALATADYGGVSIATTSFTIQGSTVCSPCTGVYYGVWFSTGVASLNPDFADVYDSTDARLGYSGIDSSIRFYNTNQLFTSTQATSGFVGTPKPIRFNKGLFFKPGVSTANNIHLLYYKEP